MASGMSEDRSSVKMFYNFIGGVLGMLTAGDHFRYGGGNEGLNANAIVHPAQ